jgi:GntR family transcriptional regulator
MERGIGDEGAPGYLRIARELRARIKRGAYPERERMPTEAEFGEEFGASRITVRHALALLEREGLVRREPGRGTFATRRLVRDLVPLYSFTADMKRAGKEPRSVLMASGEFVADGDEIERLGLDERGERVYRLVRLRLADGAPVLIERTSLPLKLVPAFALADPETDSLYSTLAERYGLSPATGTETYEAVILTIEEARALGARGSGPWAGMAVTRVAKTADGRPLEFTRSVGLSERMVFSLSI